MSEERKPTVMFCQTSNTQSIDFEPGMTVEAVLSAASVRMGSGQQVRVNGSPAAMEDVVQAGQVIMLVGNTSGGA